MSRAPQPVDVERTVHDWYAAIAASVAAGCGPSGADGAGICCGASVGTNARQLYDLLTLTDVPDAAQLASMGCGNPTAVAGLVPGDVVLDLGAGAGIDVVLAARRVGRAGRVYGLDAAADMLRLARQVVAEAGLSNVELVEGIVEAIPLPERSVDVVMSNCVINLTRDKGRALAEAFRVLRPGGRLVFTDVVREGTLPPGLREDPELWAGCIAGALDAEEFRRLLCGAGFADVRIEEVCAYSADDLRSDDAVVRRQACAIAALEADGGRLMSARIRAVRPIALPTLADAELGGGVFRAAARVLLVGVPHGRTLSQATRAVGRGGEVLAIDDRSDAGAVVTAELDDFRTRPSVVADLLARTPVSDLAGLRALQAELARQRAGDPLVARESMDVVAVDGALNRLGSDRVPALLRECFRVLRNDGCLVVLALLADEAPPAPLPVASGRPLEYVPMEREIVDRLLEAGFHGVGYTWRDEGSIRVAGVEMRAHVVTARKGKQGPCVDRGHAVIYRGPWSEVHDDDGHRYVRGERTAVCEKTYGVLMRAPYREQLIGLAPPADGRDDGAPPFDCHTPRLRDPRVTKGMSAGPAATCC